MSVEQPPLAILMGVERVLGAGFWREWLATARAAIALTQARQHGLAVTSWWRSFEKNRAVGGSPQSQHLVGLAIDFVGSDHADLVRAFRVMGFEAIDEGDHVHVQTFRS